MTQNLNAAGPGSVQEQDISPAPMLDGVGQYQVVTIFNPLPVDFIGVVGQSKPVSMPFQVRKDEYTSPLTQNETDVARNYGLNLKNPDHQARMPISTRVSIRAGETLNLQGNEAQVIVRQLVNEILQRSGKKLHMADPTTRQEVERTIIRGVRSIDEVLSNTPQSVESQIRSGLNTLNEQQDEPEFPGLSQTTPTEGSGSGTSGDEATDRPVRARGRQPREK